MKHFATCMHIHSIRLNYCTVVAFVILKIFTPILQFYSHIMTLNKAINSSWRDPLLSPDPSLSNSREKERNLSQSYHKSPYTNRKLNNLLTTQKRHKKNFHYTTIVDRLRAVSWSNNSHPTVMSSKPSLLPNVLLRQPHVSTLTSEMKMHESGYLLVTDQLKKRVEFTQYVTNTGTLCDWHKCYYFLQTAW